MTDRIPFTPAIRLSDGFDGSHLSFVFVDRRIVLDRGGIIEADLRGHDRARSVVHLGRYGEQACHAIELEPGSSLPDGLEAFDLRFVGERLGDDLFDLAGRASQLLEWDRTHRFCGACGTPTVAHDVDRARLCPACKHLAFPRLSPAIIVAVERGDELLLARSRGFPPGIFSVLAGFVEPGESVEHCVAREVFEETGIVVDDIRYFGSQPWPFPHSLMLGFTAKYVSGEVTPDGTEIEEADFFHVDAFPKTFRGRLSIAQWLITDFLERRGRA